MLYDIDKHGTAYDNFHNGYAVRMHVPDILRSGRRRLHVHLLRRRNRAAVGVMYFDDDKFVDYCEPMQLQHDNYAGGVRRQLQVCLAADKCWKYVGQGGRSMRGKLSVRVPDGKWNRKLRS